MGDEKLLTMGRLQTSRHRKTEKGNGKNGQDQSDRSHKLEPEEYDGVGAKSIRPRGGVRAPPGGLGTLNLRRTFFKLLENPGVRNGDRGLVCKGLEEFDH